MRALRSSRGQHGKTSQLVAGPQIGRLTSDVALPHAQVPPLRVPRVCHGGGGQGRPALPGLQGGLSHDRVRCVQHLTTTGPAARRSARGSSRARATRLAVAGHAQVPQYTLPLRMCVLSAHLLDFLAFEDERLRSKAPRGDDEKRFVKVLGIRVKVGVKQHPLS